MTLSDYLLREVQEIAELPTIPELTQRIRQHTPDESQDLLGGRNPPSPQHDLIIDASAAAGLYR